MKTRIIRPRQNRVRKTSEVRFENKGIQTSPYINAQLPIPLRPQASKEERPKDLVSLYHHPLYNHQLRAGNIINRPKVRTYSDHNHIVTFLEGLGEHNITFYINRLQLWFRLQTRLLSRQTLQKPQEGMWRGSLRK